MRQTAPLFEKQERSVMSVSQLTGSLRNTIESRFNGIWVEGEISNFKRHTSGHCYFTLKDTDSQIRSVMFRGQARHVSFQPRDGLLVEVYGDASVYEPRGDLQVITRSMKLAGEGALQKAFEALKRKLATEGLFERDRKRPVPAFPQRIGIITSDSGAALHDILSVIQRRFPQVDVLLCPVRVQGAGAAEGVCRAIATMNRLEAGPDVLIVGRGGGSLEDLWTFNEESVARAIVGSKIPVISAVGHETDFSIADLVADVRAATPSMAAELAVPDRQELTSTVRKLLGDVQACTQRGIDRYRQHVRYLLSSHSFRRPIDQLRQRSQQVDDLAERLNRFAASSVITKRRRLQSLGQRLDLLRPDLPLERGFVLVERHGRIVRRSNELANGEAVSLRFEDGKRTARIQDDNA